MSQLIRVGNQEVPTEKMVLEANNVSAGYSSETQVLHDVSVRALPGEVTTLIGPNGCGKSTLLKTMSKLVQPSSGLVQVGDKDLHSLSPREAARLVALLPQQPVAPDGLLVGELIARGRHPHQGRFRSASAQDDAVVEWASEQTGITNLLERDISALSGGQRQRVWLAMTLAQETPVLLLDEPTTYLDPAHAIEMLEVVREQARAGKIVVMVLHDLILAGQYSDTVVVMRDGSILEKGTPKEAICPDVLAEAYQLRADVWEDPSNGAPVTIPRAALK